jgi:hypothetical protein
VADVPFGTACHDYLSFDGGLAALATGAEHFVEIQMAVEPWYTGFMIIGLGS